MEQGLSAGQFDQWKFPILLLERSCQSIDFRLNLRERPLFPFGEGISRVAIGTAQVAGGEADKNARQAGKSALALQAEVNLVND